VLGKAKDPNRLAKKVKSDQANLNMQKKADGRRINESEAINRLYREVKFGTMAIPVTEAATSKKSHFLSRSIPVTSE
jgi:hypothetical protein